MKKEPLISIIIPVYNIEKYLFECLRSILTQDYKNFEIICVNDGSSDNSLSVLKYFRRRDKRLKIINTEHRNSGIARNLAMEQACGKYLAFVDGDDLLEKNALFEMLNKAEKENTDVLMFGAFSYYVKKDSAKKYARSYDYKRIPEKYFKRVFSCEEPRKDIVKFPATAWTKLYKSDFIKKNEIIFQDIEIGQDQLFFFHSMICAKRIAVLEKNIYCYRKNRKGSAMTDNKNRSHSPIEVFYAVEELLQKKKALNKYKDIFIDKYFIKASSRLARFEKQGKKLYFFRYIELLEHIKASYPDGWWMCFSPCIDDSLPVLKCRILIAKVLRPCVRLYQAIKNLMTGVRIHKCTPKTLKLPIYLIK